MSITKTTGFSEPDPVDGSGDRVTPDSISLPLDPSMVEVLIVKVRGFMGKEANDIPDVGSNFTDDTMPPASFQDERDDPIRQETRDNIRGLPRTEQAALIALMWLGRGDGQLADWPELMREAMSRLHNPADMYLFNEPLLAEYWEEGLEAFRKAGSA